jgi:hypothetical protein
MVKIKLNAMAQSVAILAVFIHAGANKPIEEFYFGISRLLGNQDIVFRRCR